MKIKTFFLFLLAISGGGPSWAGELTRLVDPYIGTGGHGHVFLGANVPFGMVQLGPTEPCRGWDWCSGYHYSDSVLVGFSHLHLSGTGIGDLGDITLMPLSGTTYQTALFSHRDETVRPGYYSLNIKESGIRAELTSTIRCGMHRYSFPAGQDQLRLALDLGEGIGWDGLTTCSATLVGDRMVVGHRRSKGWARDQQVFFAAEFSQPITLAPQRGDTVTIVSTANEGRPLLVRVGLSAVSTDGARLNLKEELPTWDFDDVAQAAEDAWEKQLSKMVVKTPDERSRRIFYTALYHTMVAPSVFCDVDGKYRGADGQVHHGDFVNYTTFSLWDTYRAAHPLMTLIHPEMQADIAQTMLHIYKEQGRLPVWHLMGNETDCMVGNPGIPVICDIALKGYQVDLRQVLDAAQSTALGKVRGLPLLREHGYLPFDLDKEQETVARGLEYALADYCVARVAERLGDEAVRRLFYDRSQAYRRYFDSETGFMRAVDSKGHFREHFNPFEAAGEVKDYTEGNAWQYLWLVPHDVRGLVGLLGGERPFVRKLDSLFVAQGDLGAEAPPDISGLIGQYAHGNEPSHHVAYLYHFVGMPWKSAPILRRIFAELYGDTPDGLSGNEDVGQMSAWYILSSMGLYQVEPAGGRYLIGSPLFDSVEMSVRGNKTFRIVAHGNSDQNIYVQSAKLNGHKYSKSYIDFENIVCGGTLELFMGTRPSRFGASAKCRP